MKNKFLYLLKNTGLLMISNFSSKILVFLLVPLYTSVLTTEEYGSYDLLHTTMLMLLPILTANITDSIMRFAIGAEFSDQRQTLSIGIKYTGLSIVLITVGSFLFTAITQNPLMQQYQIHFVLLYSFYAINQLISHFAKGIDDIRGLSISGVLGTAAMLAGNLFFLLYAKLGLSGYFYANILASAVPAVFLFCHGKMYRYLSGFRQLHKRSDFERQMLRYSVPLTMNTLSWYINNVSDRYIVTWLCGIAVNGIYSVAYKIPAILNAVQTIFIQAWQLSAIREYDPKDQDGFYSKTYQSCHTVMVLLCSSIIIGTRIIARILFANEFYTAWEFVPTLLLYIVFNTLSGTIGGVFSAVMDSASVTKSAVAGALVNVVLNIVLVLAMGAMGAAIATVISSIVIWAMRLYYSRKHIQLQFNLKQHIVEYTLLIVQAVAMTIIEHPAVYAAQIAIWLILIIINLKELRKVIRK